MNYIYILIVILFAVLVFWFRKRLFHPNKIIILIFLTGILGGIFGGSILLFGLEGINSGSIILFGLKNFDLGSSIIYSSVIGPILEELIKFIIIYIIISTIKDNFQSNLIGLTIGLLVGLGFGLYENFIYIKNGLDNIWILLYRSIFVGGIILHPLTCGIYGYLIFISNKLPNILPKVFNEIKKEFHSIFSITDLVKMIYKNSQNSIKTILDFLKRILILDVTIKYILGGKEESSSGFGHGPIEIVYEGLLLGIWMHVLYNTILTQIGTPSVILVGFAIPIVIILFRLFAGLFNSYFVGSLISFIIILGFWLKNPDISSKLLYLSLIILTTILLMISLELNKKLNKTQI